MKNKQTMKDENRVKLINNNKTNCKIYYLKK